MKTYVKPEIIVKSLATDEMLMTNHCGELITDVCKEEGRTNLKDLFFKRGHGLDDGYIRACTGS